MSSQQAIPDGVLDIGGSQTLSRLQNSIAKKLVSKDSLNRHFLPDVFFSDDEGLRLWHKLNCLPDYYQTRDEVELLEQWGSEIEHFIPQDCTIIDLGCGDVRKIKPILDKLESTDKNITYFGLDLSLATVSESVGRLRCTYQNIKCFGLWGTFDDGMEWAKTIAGPRLFLSLGSIFANDRFDRAVKYLTQWTHILRPADLMLIGIDCLQDSDAVWKSYHDSDGLFEKFIRNGFAHANRVSAAPWYRHEDWEIRGDLDLDPVAHRFILKAVRDVDSAAPGIRFKAGDEIECYEGYKQTPELVHRQLEESSLDEIKMWQSPSGSICK
ncbi:DUF323 domain-containing protein [Lasiosphaeria hispida]|uniref:4-dimethylallyltryptophan N-methyltransferase n=1 Tax=Lasiosphaeria hispida TaxID=260671 RepID=A0AAJ0H7S6_9PEZI|nr:DUF323 domain-containing protein [Lasiosphaeria hispida]